jgi:hypothetical protein
MSLFLQDPASLLHHSIASLLSLHLKTWRSKKDRKVQDTLRPRHGMVMAWKTTLGTHRIEVLTLIALSFGANTVCYEKSTTSFLPWKWKTLGWYWGGVGCLRLNQVHKEINRTNIHNSASSLCPNVFSEDHVVTLISSAYSDQKQVRASTLHILTCSTTSSSHLNDRTTPTSLFTQLIVVQTHITLASPTQHNCFTTYPITQIYLPTTKPPN